MASTKSAYGTSNQAITLSLASLATAAARVGTAVDNTANLFLDALAFVKIKSGATGTSATGYVNVYAIGTADGGTTYTENAGATDAGATLTAPPNARLIGVVNVVANATTYYAGPFSVGAAFGGLLPDHWSLIVENQSGHALDTTEGNFGKWYQGIYSTTA